MEKNDTQHTHKIKQQATKQQPEQLKPSANTNAQQTANEKRPLRITPERSFKQIKDTAGSLSVSGHHGYLTMNMAMR